MSENSSTGEVTEGFSSMKKSAGQLVQTLEDGDYSSARKVIQQINEERDQSIYKEVGTLTRAIHESIVEFNVDLASYGVEGTSADDAEALSAKDRLDYVIKLCQDAANTTMDKVEEGIPVSDDLSKEAAELREKWGRLIRREMDPEEFRELYQRIDLFLETTTTSANTLNEKFNSILMAQGYQDLAGQIIQKVIKLVQDVEGRLVGLVTLASQVEQITGVAQPMQEAGQIDEPNSVVEAEGPQINAEQRVDVVSGQDEVDDLLSSLGF